MSKPEFSPQMLGLFLLGHAIVRQTHSDRSRFKLGAIKKAEVAHLHAETGIGKRILGAALAGTLLAVPPRKILWKRMGFDLDVLGVVLSDEPPEKEKA